MGIKLTAYEPDCWVWLAALVWRRAETTEWNLALLLSYKRLAFLNGGSALETLETKNARLLGLPDRSKSPKEYAAIQSQMDHVQVAITCRITWHCVHVCMYVCMYLPMKHP